MADTTNRTLYLAGEYQNPVTVNASFSNGLNCSATGEYSHAEGSNTSASGESSHAEGKNCMTGPSAEGSHAGGVKASATHRECFVWNGIDTVTYQSRGDGTFCINPSGGKSGFYIGEESLQDILNDISESSAEYARRNNSNTFTRENTFTQLISLAKDAQAQFMNGTVTVATPDDASAMKTANDPQNGNIAASAKFVKKYADELRGSNNEWSGTQRFVDGRTVNHPSITSNPNTLADVGLVNDAMNGIRNNYETWVFTLMDGTTEVRRNVLLS